ncbi:MAG: hypothetical protein WD751_11090 [Anaerolineales bacterium]
MTEVAITFLLLALLPLPALALGRAFSPYIAVREVGGSLRRAVSYDFQLTTPIVGSIIGPYHFPLSLKASCTTLRPEC